ncbi:MAG: transporter substrate-binding domain-containing protein [Lachnospiraceae bacterium]|nr:transporter substrate-binding domain-containing protein [Lachnospiraceae bacterium]
MKKIYRVVIGVMCILLSIQVLAGCAQRNGREAADGDLLSLIQERGELIVAMEGTWAPWTYHDESGSLAGYDVEVAQLIAEKLGVRATFVEGEWDGLLAGMDAGRYDILVNGVDITKERQEKYDFTVPYAYNHTVIIVNGDNEDIHSLEDLAGRRTANTISGIFAETAERYGAKVTGVTALNQSFELLANGRVDATLNDEVTYQNYVDANPEADVKIAARTEDVSQIAIPMRKGEETESLREAVNKALEELRISGQLGELSEKYFGMDISKVENEKEADSSADELELIQETEREEDMVRKMNVQIGNAVFTATLEKNDAVSAFVEMLQENPVVLKMNDYSGFEKVGSLGKSLPASNSQTTTNAGDIVLYNENQIVIFYGSNSWSYTRLGHIDDLTGWEEALGSGDVTVTFSLE